jgi:hypothetical protein
VNHIASPFCNNFEYKFKGWQMRKLAIGEKGFRYNHKSDPFTIQDILGFIAGAA